MFRLFISGLFLMTAFAVNAQHQNDISFDYFRPNSQLVRIRDTAPNGEQMTIYLDYLKDYSKADVHYVMSQIDKGTGLFQDSLYDATRTHVLEVAITKDQEHTFYRYASYPAASTDITIVDGQTRYIKHRPDTIRVYEHFEKFSMGDTIHYCIVYEILSKDLSRAGETKITKNMLDVHEYRQEKRERYMNLKNVIQRLGVYFGAGLAINPDAPVGMHMDMGLIYQTGRKYNGYTPFIGYSFRGNTARYDGLYQGAQFHMLEWGIMKSNFGPYHLLYNKYSMGVGIMQIGNANELEHMYTDQPYYLAVGLNYPIAHNMGVSIDVGGQLFRKNPKSYVSISFKAYLSLGM